MHIYEIKCNLIKIRLNTMLTIKKVDSAIFIPVMFQVKFFHVCIELNLISVPRLLQCLHLI